MCLVLGLRGSCIRRSVENGRTRRNPRQTEPQRTQGNTEGIFVFMGALEVMRYLRRFEMAGKPVLKNLRVSSGPWCWVGVLGLTILSVQFAACSSQRGAEA